MKRLSIITIIIFSFVAVSCSNSATEQTDSNENEEQVDLQQINLETMIKEIKKREEAYNNEETINNRNAVRLMQAYAAYSERFSNYENADEYLFQAGVIAMGLNMTVESLRYLDKLQHEYPQYANRAEGLFYKAFVLENHAQNLEEAKIMYEQFLQDYPNHEMADDARMSIKNLGKSPEEIIREFEIQDSLRKLQETS